MRNKNKNFDAAQHELDSALHKERHNHALRHKILRDLNIEHEALTQTPTNKHAVRVHNEHAKHSRYILDLREKKKQQTTYEEKKKEIHAFIKTHKKTNSPTMPRAVRTAVITNNKPIRKKITQGADAKKYDDQFTTEWNTTLISFWRLAPRLAAAAVTLGALIVLPLYGFAYYNDLKNTKSDLSALSQTTAADFQGAMNSLMGNDSDAAKNRFIRAADSLLQMDQKLNDINFVVTTISGILGGEQRSIKTAKLLVGASENLSMIGILAGKTVNDFYTLTDGKSFVEKIEFVAAKTNTIAPLLKEANEKLADVSPEFVATAANNNSAVDGAIKFAEMKNKLAAAETILSDFNAAADSMLDALGKFHKKRYLIVFQNNNELRATGGFLGSFAIVEIDNGKIKNVRVPSGGTYDLQGSLTESVAAPYPLRLVNAKFEFQDANWFPDFPTSAQKMEWFLEKSNWPTVDGVFAVNASWAAKLIDFVGPLNLQQYGKTFDGKNFIDELQKITLDKNNKAAPKQIIADLATKLLETLPTLRDEQLIPLLTLIKTGMDEKDILSYFNDSALENVIKKYGWGGETKQTDGDYLQIVNSNIGGGKSDVAIEQKTELTVEITQDGTIINTLTISRRNNAKIEDEFAYENNVDFLRVYVPDGSELLESSGDFEIPTPEQFEQTEPQWKTDNTINVFERRQYIDSNTQTITSREFGKTVFANWLQTKPGETTTATFKYKLPFSLKFEQEKLNFFERQYKTAATGTAAYSLLSQKQPGQRNNLLSVKILTPDNFNAVRNDIGDDGFKTEMTIDELLKIEFTKK